MREGRDPRLLMLKVAALLHDPPHKAWIVLGKYKVQRSEGSEAGVRAHELEACRMAEQLLKGTPLEDSVSMIKSREVHEADILASSIDRLLYSGEGRKQPWGALHIANMFDPSVKYRPESRINEANINEYVNALKGVLQEILAKDDLITAYHALYALLEPLWFSKVRVVGPADTRIPNHTIFDHLYATATAINAVYGGTAGDVGGFLVLLDIAGIQSFISKARKVRDFWASSWLVSALAWYLIREVVEVIGPDCMVMPTARLNPFYVTWLLGRAQEKRYGRLANELRSNLRKVIGEGWPRNPVMPGTIVLMLPPNTLELLGSASGGATRLEEYFMRRFGRAWREVLEAVKSSMNPTEGVFRKLRDALKVVEDFPPLMLRVKVVSLKYVKRELEGILNAEYVRAFLYHHALRKVFEKDTSDAVAVESGALVDWEEVTRDGNYRLCTVCGKLPAIVGEGDAPAIREWLSVKEREHLCPYCMVKRALGRHDVLCEVVRRLVGAGVSVGRRPIFPSTADIASTWAKLTLMSNVSKMDVRRSRKLLNALLKHLPVRVEEFRLGIVSYEEVVGVLRRKLWELVRMYGEEDPRTLTALLLLYEDAEGLILGRKGEKGLVFRVTNQDLKDFVDNVNVMRYYVILSADGDDVGELLSGRVWLAKDSKGRRENREEALAKYYLEVLRDDAEGTTDDVNVEKRVQGSVRNLDSAMSTYESSFNTACGAGKMFMPLTLSYHSCISRALMATAIKDSDIVEEFGVVVYAGGDDLKALLPVALEEEVAGERRFRIPFIEVIRSSRRMYWGVDSPVKGFILVGGVSPALRAVGRSYSAKISHYKDPLGANIEVSTQTLHVAKQVTTRFHSESGSTELRKDAVCIAYGRGTPEYVVLPNRCGRSEPCALLDTLIELEGLIRRRYLSESVVRDVEGVEDLAVSAFREGLTDYARKILEATVLRNVSRGKEDEIRKLLRERQAYSAAEVTDREGRRYWVATALFKALKLVLDGER